MSRHLTEPSNLASGSKPYRNPLKSRLQRTRRFAPKGPHPMAPARTSIRRAIREARQQLREAERDQHIRAKAIRALLLTTTDGSAAVPETTENPPTVSDVTGPVDEPK